jgi:hypothetical protein
LEEIRQKERDLAEKVVRDLRLAGDAHYNNYISDRALIGYERALTYVSRQQTPQLWAAIQIDIGRANWELGIRAEGLAIGQYLSSAVEAYHHHETRFEFPRAFMLNQRWLERNPADIVALSDFAERHFTTGRFSECEQRIALLLTNPAVEPSIQIALQAIQIPTSLALGKTDLVPGRIDALVEDITNQ